MLKIMLCLLVQQPNLDELVAPVALFPDPVLAQIFAAATFPLDVVEAARWQEANKNLKGPELKAALEKQRWDSSIKGLVGTPQVLQSMSKRLSWTREVGEAFTAHPKELMAAVQDFRARSQAAGKLKSSENQKVVEEEGTISIQPTDPGHVSIPLYNVERVNEGQYVPAGTPAFGTAEYDSMYGFWGMDWGGSGLWVAPPPGDIDIDIQRNTVINNPNFDRGQLNSQASQAAVASAGKTQATRWQRVDPRARPATAGAATAGTLGANRPKAPASSAAKTAGTAKPQARPAPRPGRGDRVPASAANAGKPGNAGKPANPNMSAQNRQRVAAAFGDYGRGSNVSAARARGMQSRQHYGRGSGAYHRPAPRQPMARQAPPPRQNAFQNYGSGRQAAAQSMRGQGSRGGRGGGGRGGRR